MRIFLIMIICGFVLIACKNQKWEYKVVEVEAETYNQYDRFGNQTKMLNKMGQDGWELVNVYTEINSSFPNFGTGNYVTGIKTNTQTSVLNFIFKRPFSGAVYDEEKENQRELEELERQIRNGTASEITVPVQ